MNKQDRLIAALRKLSASIASGSPLILSCAEAQALRDYHDNLLLELGGLTKPAPGQSGGQPAAPPAFCWN